MSGWAIGADGAHRVGKRHPSTQRHDWVGAALTFSCFFPAAVFLQSTQHSFPLLFFEGRYSVTRWVLCRGALKEAAALIEVHSTALCELCCSSPSPEPLGLAHHYKETRKQLPVGSQSVGREYFPELEPPCVGGRRDTPIDWSVCIGAVQRTGAAAATTAWGGRKVVVGCTWSGRGDGGAMGERHPWVLFVIAYSPLERVNDGPAPQRRPAGPPLTPWPRWLRGGSASCPPICTWNSGPGDWGGLRASLVLQKSSTNRGGRVRPHRQVGTIISWNINLCCFSHPGVPRSGWNNTGAPCPHSQGRGGGGVPRAQRFRGNTLDDTAHCWRTAAAAAANESKVGGG